LGAGAVTQTRTLLQELNLPAIWFLVACSVLIVWLVIDLYLRSARRELLPAPTLATVRASFRRGDFQAAFDACAGRTTLFATAVLAALRHASEGKAASEDAAAGALEAGQARLQTRIAYLSVIGVIAPMVGLTGTVLGMIDAFAAMGQPGAADPARLSGAIGHVLHATAGGLIVAIPAFVLHYVLRSRVAHAVRAVADEVQELFRGFPYASRAGVDFRGAERGVPRESDPPPDSLAAAASHPVDASGEPPAAPARLRAVRANPTLASIPAATGFATVATTAVSARTSPGGLNEPPLA
jgi:biopolymer transport protein ExbB